MVTFRQLYVSLVVLPAALAAAASNPPAYREFKGNIEVQRTFGGPTCESLSFEKIKPISIFIKRNAKSGAIDGYLIGRDTTNPTHFTGPDPEQLTGDVAVNLTTPPIRFSFALRGVDGPSPSGEYHRLPEPIDTPFCFVDSATVTLTPIHDVAGDPASDFARGQQLFEIAHTLQPSIALARQQKFQEALAIDEQAMHQAEKAYGDNDAWVTPYLGRTAQRLIVLARYSEAEPLLERALEINTRVYGAGSLEAAGALSSLANLANFMLQFQRSESLYRQSIALYEQKLGPDNTYEVGALQNLAQVLNSTNRSLEAESIYRHALAIIDKFHFTELPPAAEVSSSLASLLVVAGQYGEAESLYRHALAINEHAYGSLAPVVGANLTGLAQLMITTARYDEAESLSRRAVAIDERAFGTNHPKLANDLRRLALAVLREGHAAEAVPYYEQALAILEKNFGQEDARTAAGQNDLAFGYETLGRYAEAEPLFRHALAVDEQKLGPDHPEVARNSMNLGRTLLSMGRTAEAIELFERGYRIGRTSRDAELAWRSSATLMRFYRDQRPRPELAIYYGKGAVNDLQRLRSNLGDASEKTQQDFAGTIAPVYRDLAGIMIGQGRLAEAQQVLAMLKESEYFDFIQRSSSEDPRSTSASCTGAECGWEERFQQISDQLVKLSQDDADLTHIANRTPEQQAQKDRDDADLIVARKAFDAVAVSIASGESSQTARDERYRNLRASTVSLQGTIGKLGHGAVLVQYIIMDDRVHILLTTPHVVVAREAIVTRADLNAKIFAFRTTLSSPAADPLPQAQALYQLLIGPIAKDLQQAGARTLMLSLDDTLRYLPFAALNDGKHYLVENLAIDVVNEAVRSHLADAPNPGWTVWGLGVTQAHEGFKPLLGVQQELVGIIGPQGIEGKMRLDDQFTERSLQDGIEQDYPVIHIASHYQFVPGDAAKSFLLLGDGSHLSLADIKSGIEFGNVELLTLSACQTAVGGGADSHGMEVEGLGEVAQEQGAKAVLASLWPVADQSTALLMESLYHLHQEDHLTKAEALRQAQLALLRGIAKVDDQGTVDRGAQVLGGSPPAQASFKPDPAAPFAHPYFWAPFILMGNWL